jgi:hypothetical protein
MPPGDEIEDPKRRGVGARAASALLLALIHRSAWNRYSANFALLGTKAGASLGRHGAVVRSIMVAPERPFRKGDAHHALPACAP